MLTGAKVNTKVKEIITNLSSFVRNQPASSADSATLQSPHESGSDAESSSNSPDHVQSADGVIQSRLTNAKVAASHRMVIQPRHDWTVSSHGCPICPANLCKVSFINGTAMMLA